MKILAISDAGCTTGFGTVGHELYSRWVAAGHSVHVLAINYRGDPWDDGGYKLYPAAKYNPADVYGLMRVPELLKRVQPDVVFMLNDLPVLHQYLFANTHDGDHSLLNQPLVIYAPIDCVGLPSGWVRPLLAASVPVVQSAFGQRVLREEHGVDVAWLPHGINRYAFFPVSAKRPLSVVAHEGGQSVEVTVTSKAAAKAMFHYEGRFIVLAINRNSIRKNFGDTFRVFAEFAKDKPEALLYVHAALVDEGGNLWDLVDRYGLKDQVQFSAGLDTFEGYSTLALNAFYNMADVFLTTSLGEGHGLTAHEALACGLPVVAQEFSALKDVVGPGGIVVPSERLFTSARGVDLSYPDWRAMVAALNELYDKPYLRETLGRRGRDHAMLPLYDWDNIASAFIEHLETAVMMGPKERGV